MTEPNEDATATAVREPRRRASGVLVGVAALALVGALAACQPPESDPGNDASSSGDMTTAPAEETTEPEPTATDDDTDGGTDEDTDGGTDDDTDGGTDDDTDGSADDDAEGGTDGGTGGTGGGTDAGLPDFSDAVFPECGDSFALPDRTSGLVVEGGPSEALPDHGGGWMTTVTNNTDELVQGQIAMLQLIVVDGDGSVVAAPDPDDSVFMGAEGPFWMGVAAGQSLDVGIPMTHGCATGDWLPAGDYQAYAAITFVNSEGDFGDMEQAQGGPWDITVGGGSSDTAPIIPPGAAVANLECGAAWTDSSIDTGYELELIHKIRSPRSATDDIDGSALLHTGGSMDGLAFTVVLVLQDGKIVNWTPGSDTATSAAATAGVTIPLGFTSELFSCGSANDPKPLPAGSYEALVVAVTANGEGTHVLATTDPVALELT